MTSYSNSRAKTFVVILAILAIGIAGLRYSASRSSSQSGTAAGIVMGEVAGYPSYCAKPGQTVNAAGWPPYRDDCAANKVMADRMAVKAGYDSAQVSCLNTLWQESSGFDIYHEGGEGMGTGIPAMLEWEQPDGQFWLGAPGPSGMKITTGTTKVQPPAITAEVQIKAGLSYIQQYYKNACNALAYYAKHGFYAIY